MSKRTFELIRTVILLQLSKGKKTINQLANETAINWKTVENHLTYLVGRGMVTEIFSSKYVRIFELTKEGKEHISKIDPLKLFNFEPKKEEEEIASFKLNGLIHN